MQGWPGCILVQSWLGSPSRLQPLPSPSGIVQPRQPWVSPQSEQHFAIVAFAPAGIDLRTVPVRQYPNPLKAVSVVAKLGGPSELMVDSAEVPVGPLCSL